MHYSTRFKELQPRRIFLSFKSTVELRQDNDTVWQEEVDILSSTQNGASFCLSQSCFVGQLVLLKMQMPSYLRVYDEDKEVYHVWGIVQHCHKVNGNEAVEFHIGVAFIGQMPPSSYLSNPLQSFKICGMNEDKFWKVAPTIVPFIPRKHLRFWFYVQLVIQVLDFHGNIQGEENTVAENISIRGTVIYSNLDLQIGDCLRVICHEYDFSTIAVVRDCKSYNTNLKKLHLEFVDVGFPVQKLPTNQANCKQITFVE